MPKGLSNPNWHHLPFFPTVLSLCSADDKTQVMYTDTIKDTSLSMASSYGEAGFCALCFFSKLESDQEREWIKHKQILGYWLTFVLVDDQYLWPYTYHGFPGTSAIKTLPANAGDTGLIPGSGRYLEEKMTTHSSILAWKIPWTEEPDRLQSMGLQKSDMTEQLNQHYS